MTALALKELKYTNQVPVWLDLPGTSPSPMSPVVWTQSGTWPSVFVSGSKINATATFTVAPQPSAAISGARIEGSISGQGLLVAGSVNIPAGANEITVNLTGDTAFPSSTTVHNSALQVNWVFSLNGQPCPSQCTSAGSSASEVYVTLANPSGVSVSPPPLTAVKLAIGNGGATTPTMALQNTWQQFSGPANVRGWDGRPLYYYAPGVPFSGCATTSANLLSYTNGSGQCGAWAKLFQDAPAVNAISSTFVTVESADGTSMLVKNWTFGTPSFPDAPPYNWKLTLQIESGGVAGMVPLPADSVFGNLTSQSTLYGQNTSPPSEKFFGSHFIVKLPSTVGGGYFDPSYGVTYNDACEFESKAVAGYGLFISSGPSTADYKVRQPSGACNITFSN